MFKKISIVALAVIMALMAFVCTSCGSLTETDVLQIVEDALLDNTDNDSVVNGKDGADGITPHIGENGNWFIGETDTGVAAQGPAGPAGADGKDGINGVNGKDGIDGKDFVVEDLTKPYDRFDNLVSWVDVAGFGALYEREDLKVTFDAFDVYNNLKAGTVPAGIVTVINDIVKTNPTANSFTVRGVVHYYNTMTNVLTVNTFIVTIERATINGITYGPYINTTTQTFVENTSWVDNIGVTFIEHK